MNISKDKNDQLFNTKKTNGISTDDLESAIKKLFNDMDYLFQKGKGYSLYNVSASSFIEILKILEEIITQNYSFIKVSDLVNPIIDNLSFNEPLIIYQDLNLMELLECVDTLVNKFIYPAWYNSCPIVFISRLDKRNYNAGDIKSSMIHTDYNQIINLLSLEQLDNLLDLVNSNILSSEMILTFDSDVLYTPIEKIFRDRLIERNISFKPQVKLGRFYVDFLLEIRNSKIIVECDGRDYHDKDKDKERDKELKREGYEIFRFSGSRIFTDCDSCIDEVILYTSRKNSPKYLIEELNEDQLKAVNHISGPIRVLAPAGSGKTKTLVNRIVNLVNNGVHEAEILALAFNKKAEKEMSKRLAENFNLSNIEVRTFHSFGNKIIREILKWNFNGDTQEKVTRNLLEKSVKKYETIVYMRNKDPLDEYLDMLSRSKNELLSKGEMFLEVNEKAVNFEPIFNEYISLMANNNFYNFDDMLYIAIRKLLSDSILRKKVQNKYKYILVDEFQDLNKAQLLLLQILILPENNIFICGDDDQMIYSFRGAEVRHILEFNNRYVINSDQVLKINYRSASNIVKHSKWLIDHNNIRVYKEITPFSKNKGNIQLFVGDTLKIQGEKIAEWILQLKNENTKWSDFAIIYRYNQYKDLLNLILTQHKIPIQFDGVKILNSRVGKCIMAYFNILCNKENSNVSDYENVLKRPNKYFTNVFIDTIKSWEDFINVDKAKLNLRDMDIAKYINFVDKFKIYDTSDKKPIEVFNYIVESFDLINFFKDESNLSKDVDIASDIDVLEIILSFSETFNSIEDFYNFWTSLEDSNTGNLEISDEEGEDTVNLTTIHKTKGNEYKHVAYFNLVRSVTLHASDIVMEEERRITYVGITRPKDHLLVTTEKNELSPFISEIFLNPQYYDLTINILKNKLKKNSVEVNVLNSNLSQIEIELDKLTTKYPELKGLHINTNGIFNKIKQTFRRININIALKKYHSYNDNKTTLLNNLENLNSETTSIQDELKYRKIIEESKEN